MGYALFRKEPTSVQVRVMLGRAIAAAGKALRYLLCDSSGARASKTGAIAKELSHRATERSASMVALR
jgi:hypothetical protein